MPPKRLPVAPALRRAQKQALAQKPAVPYPSTIPTAAAQAADSWAAVASQHSNDAELDEIRKIIKSSSHKRISLLGKAMLMLNDTRRGKSESVDQLLDRAVDAMDENDAFDTGKWFLKEYVARKTKDADLYASKLFLHSWKNGHKGAAIELYQMLIFKKKFNTAAIKQSDEVAVTKAVESLAMEGDYNAAIQLARVAVRYGDHVAARKFYAKAAVVDAEANTGEAGLYMARYYEDAGNPQEALKWYDNAAKCGSPTGHIQRAKLLSKAGVSMGSHVPFSPLVPHFPAPPEVDDGPVTKYLRDCLLAASGGAEGAAERLVEYYRRPNATPYENKVSDEWERLIVAQRIAAEKTVGTKVEA